MKNTKNITPAQKYMLFAASGLVLIMGVLLFFGPNQTDKYFAWTIGIELTAAFLGAGYLASFVLEFMAARESIWARGRVAVPSVLLFTTLTFIITLIHLDKFHLDSDSLHTLIITWAWILVYALVPLIMGFILIQQVNSQGVNPIKIETLPLWFKLVLGFQSIIMLILGSGLLFSPNDFASFWPWNLTSLTGRAIGAWLFGVGIAAGQSVIENDWLRLKPMMLSYMLWGALQGLSLVRYPNANGLDWNEIDIWVYIFFILSIILIGSFGTWQTLSNQVD